jgi:hypothetical protein
VRPHLQHRLIIPHQSKKDGWQLNMLTQSPPLPLNSGRTPIARLHSPPVDDCHAFVFVPQSLSFSSCSRTNGHSLLPTYWCDDRTCVRISVVGRKRDAAYDRLMRRRRHPSSSACLARHQKQYFNHNFVTCSSLSFISPVFLETPGLLHGNQIQQPSCSSVFFFHWPY